MPAGAAYALACPKSEVEASFISPCFKLGLLEEEMGNVNNARTAYAESCESYNSHACYHLGHLELKTGKREEAKTAFQKGCDLEKKRKNRPACEALEELEARRSPPPMRWPRGF